MTEIPHWLEKQFEIQPDAIAIETENGLSLTFAELRTQSRRIAAGLKSKGVYKGQHIAFLAGNHLHYVVLIHAVSYLGAVVICLNTRLSPNELAYQINDSDAALLVADNQFIELGEQSISKGEAEIPLISLESIPKKEKTEDLVESLDLSKPFTMMYTSGTTGKPKAVIHTYGNHWFSAVASALNLGLRENDKWLVCLPLFHVGGFSILMKNVIYGMPVVLMEKFSAEAVNHQITERKVSLVSLVTVMLQRLMDQRQKEVPGTFRGALLGGGPVPESLLRKASQANVPVFQTYGMTETSSQISTLRPIDAVRKLGSAGKALSPASLKILSQDKICSPYEIGEIQVKGPMVSSGYYNHAPHREEYFSTGDLGYLDEEGYLYVVDRVTDMIISGGENIYPAEIESTLLEIEGVQEAAVTGVDHPEWGEVPAAFIVRNHNHKVTEEDIHAYCKDKLAGYKLPRSVYFIKEIPRNAANKMVRRNLQAAIQKEDIDEYK
ncbi:o-succinylbenzoate--CoA ligase [Halobacillus sp. Marseille-P3879]|uniref:o-succinylbenzoate--CoA ligase n=1 Tax=Halobacillus sp. Marseille-P3879 TaxID=2045014 RepID=UPI000C7BACBA|nr:o-succinylbenzoate--CoA ligase [Halobacillus sp. Marseille-P3879]